MKKLILRNISGKRVLLFFVLSTVVYVAMIAYTIPKVMEYANGMKLLDMMPMGYDFVYVNTLFDVLGEQGRGAYMYQQIPLDMVYPFLFGVSYCLIIAYFFNKLKCTDSPLFWLCTFPVIGAFFDYLENIGNIILLSSFPDISNFQVKANSFFTIVKSGATTISFLTLLLLLALFGISKLRKKQTGPTQQ